MNNAASSRHHHIPGQLQGHGLPEDLRGIKAFKTCKISDGSSCSPCNRYQNLDGQVTLARKRQLRTEINCHHDPIARLLPHELISKIFEFYVEDDFRVLEERKDWRDHLVTSSPLIIASICTTWRHVAVSSPQLWTHIRMILEQFCRPLDKLDILQKWISRSGELSLSLFIVCEAPEHIPGRRRALYGRIIAKVNTTSHRWRILRLSCSHSEFYRSFSGNPRGAPNLRSLCLDNTVEPFDVDEIRFGIEGSSKLRPSRVRLIWVSPRSLDINWSNVTSISIFKSEISTYDCLKLMRQASQLLECEFRDVLLTEESPQQLAAPVNPVVVHHALNIFTFGPYSGTPGMFLNSFTSPNLTHLLLGKINTSGVWHNVRGLIEGSCPRRWHILLSHTYHSAVNGHAPPGPTTHVTRPV